MLLVGKLKEWMVVATFIDKGFFYILLLLNVIMLIMFLSHYND